MRILSRKLTIVRAALVFLGYMLFAHGVLGQDLPNALPDKPVRVRLQDTARKMEEAIEPYVEKAKKTYPKAKKRFLKGLPPQYTFLVTVKLTEGIKYEIVFITVEAIANHRIYGRIASDIEILKNYKADDKYDCPEEEILDWTIQLPDGSEEGNFVGKFLDTYHPD
jgi:hypothetical protein